MTYNVCPERTLPTSLVLLPQTIAPVNESEIVKIPGECVANSQRTAPVLSAICSSSGEWTQSDDAAGKCLCLPGWEKIDTECQGMFPNYNIGVEVTELTVNCAMQEC